VSLDFERQEELSAGQIPQLASRAQRLSDDVHRLENRETRQIYDRA